MMNTESWTEIPFKLRTMQWYQLSLLLPTALFLFRDLNIWERTLKHETEMRLTFRVTKNRAWHPLQEAKAVDWSGKGQCTSDVVPHSSRLHPRPRAPVPFHYFKGFAFTVWSTWIPCANGYQGHVTQMYIFFFMDFSSTKLNVNFIPYFIFQTPQHFLCYFLYKWARFPLNRVLSYHGYVTGACGYQWRHSQA